MKVQWLIKYYIIGFIAIFSLVYHIESSEPYINWSLYPEISETKVQSLVLNKDCQSLIKLYKNEFNKNYEKNFLGFTLRKDKKLIKGLNLLKYLDFQLNEFRC